MTGFEIDIPKIKSFIQQIKLSNKDVDEILNDTYIAYFTKKSEYDLNEFLLEVKKHSYKKNNLDINIDPKYFDTFIIKPYYKDLQITDEYKRCPSCKKQLHIADFYEYKELNIKKYCKKCCDAKLRILKKKLKILKKEEKKKELERERQRLIFYQSKKGKMIGKIKNKTHLKILYNDAPLWIKVVSKDGCIINGYIESVTKIDLYLKEITITENDVVGIY